MQSYNPPSSVKTLHGLFLEANKHYGSRTAIIFENGTNDKITTMTYSTLASLSCNLATEIRGLQYQLKNQVIAITGREFDKIMITVLSVLQLPAAYVYITESNTTTVQVLPSLGVSLIISSEPLSQIMHGYLSQSYTVTTNDVIVGHGDVQKKLVFCHLEPLVSVPPAPKLTAPGLPLAYAITTSGTTGAPKVVKVPHQCILPNILQLRDILNISESDVFYNGSPLTFDTSLLQIFIALSFGGTVVSVPDEMKLNTRLVIPLLMRNKVTNLIMTPTSFMGINNQLVRSTILSNKSCLRALIFAGEPCPTLSKLSHWREEHNTTEIFNMYGITEVSCLASFYRLTTKDNNLDSVPLGEPLWETVLEVRDKNGTVITEGEGQLFIGSLSRVCYVDEEEIPKGEIIYRASGDFVDITSKGMIFLGRKDDINERYGENTRLTQITSLIENFPEVVASKLVLQRDSSIKEPRFYAFFVPVSPNAGEELKAHITKESEEIQERLKYYLAQSAWPEYIFSVPYFPVTSHGKVNSELLMKLAKEFLKDNKTKDMVI